MFMFCEVTAFAVFVFSGQVDLTVIPSCNNQASTAIQTERPRPYTLCRACLGGYVHVLARCGLIPAVCRGCADGTCAPPDMENPYAGPEWNRDPDQPDMEVPPLDDDEPRPDSGDGRVPL